VFEFSCKAKRCAGFRSLMAERVLRMFDAQRSSPGDVPDQSSVGCVLRSSSLRQSPLCQVALSSSVSSLLRPRLVLSGVRSVRVDVSHIIPVSSQVSPVLVQLKSGSAYPRLCASRRDSPKAMLNPMAPKIKRAASARLFQRLGERLASLKSRQSVGCVASVSVASECVALEFKSSVASRLS
jgi:hypothetical protein